MGAGLPDNSRWPHQREQQASAVSGKFPDTNVCSVRGGDRNSWVQVSRTLIYTN